MKALFYFLPFYYNLTTRLMRGKWGIGGLLWVLIFEWSPAILLIILYCANRTEALLTAFIVYIGFICVYEIGYMVNDLVIARFEKDGHKRGPQDAAWPWLAGWISIRGAVFLLVTCSILGKQTELGWWLYFGGLLIIYAAHNILKDPALRIGTFLWLTWYRFMAPLIFVLPEEYLPGVCFACAMCYSIYRLLIYLTDKKLLKKQWDVEAWTRPVFYIWPLVVVPLFMVFPFGSAGAVLIVYLCGVTIIISTLKMMIAKKTTIRL